MTASIVPADQAERIRDSASQPNLTAELLEGHVIHFDDDLSHFNATTLRARHGVQLRTRGDGAGGRYWWVESPVR